MRRLVRWNAVKTGWQSWPRCLAELVTKRRLLFRIGWGQSQAGGFNPKEGAAVELGVGKGGCNPTDGRGALRDSRGVWVERNNPCG